jgi:hypothetical protein
MRNLVSRETYIDHSAPRRAEHIRRRVLRWRPRAVLFASVAGRYRAYWQAIAGVKLESLSLAGRPCFVGSDRATVFVVSQHPVTKGMNNDYFQAIGEYIARQARGSNM